jgi:hypothetical protein
MSGVYQGTGSTCAQVSCPQPQGACCITGGGCQVNSQSVCEGFGNTWMGVGTDCADHSGNTLPDVCENCASPDGDLNGDLKKDGRDLKQFTQAVMTSSTNENDLCHGDFTQDGMITTDDINGMVSALLNP